jgi:ribosomal protein S18 acetylase RimI-like enzyme
MLAIDGVDAVRLVVRHPTAALLVARIDGAIVGTMLGTFDGWRGHVYRLVVHPRTRRQGIGRTRSRDGEGLEGLGREARDCAG